MARIRRAPGKPRTAIASYLVRRADEEKRRHPEKSYAQIGRELGITQKDPARMIRRLRSGETSGRRTLPRLLGRIPKPKREPGKFVVAYRWWYVERPGMKYWARVNIRVNATRLDIFRLRDDPRVVNAVERDLERKAEMKLRERDGSVPNPGIGAYEFKIDGVYPEDHAKAPALVITGKYVAA